MTIAYQTLDQAAYEDFRFDLISSVEGTEEAAYLDTRGIPTIGIGFNLDVE